MPYVVPFVAGVLIWQSMLNPDSGWINEVLRVLGIADPPDWLQDPTWIYPGLVLLGVWGIGGGIIVYLAGLKGDPERAVRRGPDRRRRLVGARCATSPCR